MGIIQYAIESHPPFQVALEGQALLRLLGVPVQNRIFTWISFTNVSLHWYLWMNTLLTALPGSPVFPLAPGPPSIPYNQKYIQITMWNYHQNVSILNCLNWCRCCCTYISTGSPGAPTSPGNPRGPYEENGWCQSKNILTSFNYGNSYSLGVLGSIWSRWPLIPGVLRPQGGQYHLLAHFTFVSLDIKQQGA